MARGGSIRRTTPRLSFQSHKHKKMIRYASHDSIQSYRNSSAVNQSFLKSEVSKGKTVTIAKASRVTGDFVDGLLTMPEDVMNYYTIVEQSPSETIQGIIEKTITELIRYDRLTDDITNHKSRLLYYARDAEYYNNKTDEKLLDTLITDTTKTWWDFLYNSQGKTLITEKDRSFGESIKDLVMQHHLLKHYFPTREVDGIDYLYQTPMFFECEGVKCKSLTDIIIINHKEKVVTIIDIKTIFLSGRDILMSEIKKNNYVFQLSFYRRGVSVKLNEKGWGDYKIECKWMFIPKNIKAWYPEIVPCTEEMMDFEEYGGITDEGSVTINGNRIKKTKTHKGFRHWLNVYKNTINKGLTSFHIQDTSPLTTEEVNEMFFN